MENINFDLQQVFREIVSRMELESAYDRDVYNDMIEEVLEEKIANAELDPDENTKNYTEALQVMWPQAEALLTKTGEEGYMVGDEDEASIPEPGRDKE